MKTPKVRVPPPILTSLVVPAPSAILPVNVVLEPPRRASVPAVELRFVIIPCVPPKLPMLVRPPARSSVAVSLSNSEPANGALVAEPKRTTPCCTAKLPSNTFAPLKSNVPAPNFVNVFATTEPESVAVPPL